MTRPYVFGTNFKMNQTPAESALFYRELTAAIEIPPDARAFIIPPFTSLAAVAEVAAERPGNLWLAAQNMHWASEGAFTGEISARMLQALGIDLVLIGHAERRQLFHEGDVDLNRKVLAALGAGLRVLLAIGETAEERGYDVSDETVLRQLKIGLHGVGRDQLDRLILGYEPVWSIGAGGTPATPGDVEPIAVVIRGALGERFGRLGADIPILYGGSVSPENAGSFTSLPDIDGLFVGRAAWSVAGFSATFEAGLAGYRAKSTGSYVGGQ